MSAPTEADRASLAQGIAADIAGVERLLRHRRTVVVGDFNMNPFEQGMVEARALHALMTRPLAQTIHRLEQRGRYPCFYNPMWSYFGDRPSRPPGTYFFSNTLSSTNHFWNIYDQVLLRPEVMDKLSHLEILDSDGQVSLLTRFGRPNRAVLSDHLPLLFRLDL
jgi:hypothetical protein